MHDTHEWTHVEHHIACSNTTHMVSYPVPKCAAHVGVTLQAAEDGEWRISKIPNRPRLTPSNLPTLCASWDNLRERTCTTKSPYIIACLMAAMVKHANAIHTFTEKLINVADGRDSDGTLLDIVLALWPHMWYTLTIAQQMRVESVLASDNITRPRKPQAIQPTQFPSKNGPPAKIAKTRQTVYPGGPMVINEFGTRKFLDKIENGPLSVLLKDNVTLTDFMLKTENTHNPLIVGCLLFKNAELLRDTIYTLLKNICNGIIDVGDDGLHIAITTAVACWPEMYTKLTAAEQEQFRKFNDITVTQLNAKRQAIKEQHKDRAHGPSVTPIYGKKLEVMKQNWQLMNDVAWVLRSYLLEFYTCFHSQIADAYPDLAAYFDSFNGHYDHEYRVGDCATGSCRHREKTCHCEKNKCPQLGCKDYRNNGKCQHAGNCRNRRCPTFLCNNKVSMYNEGRLIDLMTIMTYKKNPIYDINRFMTCERFIQPVVQSYNPACGLSIGQAALVCFAIHNARIESQLNAMDFAWSKLFQYPSEWWQSNWETISIRLPRPFFHKKEIVAIQEMCQFFEFEYLSV